MGDEKPQQEWTLHPSCHYFKDHLERGLPLEGIHLLNCYTGERLDFIEGDPGEGNDYLFRREWREEPVGMALSEVRNFIVVERL